MGLRYSCMNLPLIPHDAQPKDPAGSVADSSATKSISATGFQFLEPGLLLPTFAADAFENWRMGADALEQLTVAFRNPHWFGAAKIRELLTALADEFRDPGGMAHGQRSLFSEHDPSVGALVHYSFHVTNSAYDSGVICGGNLRAQALEFPSGALITLDNLDPFDQWISRERERYERGIELVLRPGSEIGIQMYVLNERTIGFSQAGGIFQYNTPTLINSRFLPWMRPRTYCLLIGDKGRNLPHGVWEELSHTNHQVAFRSHAPATRDSLFADGSGSGYSVRLVLDEDPSANLTIRNEGPATFTLSLESLDKSLPGIVQLYERMSRR